MHVDARAPGEQRDPAARNMHMRANAAVSSSLYTGCAVETVSTAQQAGPVCGPMWECAAGYSTQLLHVPTQPCIGDGDRPPVER